mmetsp:Transcript_11601/g.38770  ORF Transcript_11601/g.38770 Transcript_11601/m.38770 type:complete len:330 (+) Transcript_11601:1809-2798(+)
MRFGLKIFRGGPSAATVESSQSGSSTANCCGGGTSCAFQRTQLGARTPTARRTVRNPRRDAALRRGGNAIGQALWPRRPTTSSFSPSPKRRSRPIQRRRCRNCRTSASNRRTRAEAPSVHALSARGKRVAPRVRWRRLSTAPKLPPKSFGCMKSAPRRRRKSISTTREGFMACSTRASAVARSSVTCHLASAARASAAPRSAAAMRGAASLTTTRARWRRVGDLVPRSRFSARRTVTVWTTTRSTPKLKTRGSSTAPAACGERTTTTGRKCGSAASARRGSTPPARRLRMRNRSICQRATRAMRAMRAGNRRSKPPRERALSGTLRHCQ